MTYLSIRDQATGTVREFELSEIRLGRDPECELHITGQGADVVSGHHARLVHRDGRWLVEDSGSRNGTTLNEKLLSQGKPEQVTPGAVIGLGDRGPRYRVEAVEKRRIANTVIEGVRAARPSAPTMPTKSLDDATLPMHGLGAQGAPPSPPRGAAPPLRPAPPPPAPPPPPPAPPAMEISMREARTGNKYEARGGRLRLGRGEECELRPLREGDTSVSRVHAEIVLLDGRAVLRDLKSRNGTYVNDVLLVGDHTIKIEDKVMLGSGGPDLVVEALKLPGGERQEVGKKPAAAPSSEAQAAKKPGMPRRSFAGKGKTVFFREMMEETTKKSASKLRIVVWSFVVVLIGAVGGFYWYNEQQQVTTSALQEQSRALAAASEKTSAMETSLRQAESALAQQLAAGDSLRLAGQQDLTRLKNELTEAAARATASNSGDRQSQAMLDSLRAAIRGQERALKAQETKNAEIAAEMRSRGDSKDLLPTIAQESGPAVGLISVTYCPHPSGQCTYSGADSTRWYLGEDGTWFVVTASGYVITNRHVGLPDGIVPSDIRVTMNKTKFPEQSLKADVVKVSPPDGPDIAILKIRDYKGPVIPKLDWAGTHVAQGEPAAAIGFPGGMSSAGDDNSHIIQVTMSRGIFARVSPERIRFDGFTIPGSSGSPVFNGVGEVVAIHFAGQTGEDRRGLGSAVPVRFAIPLLPLEARNELGLR